ncbi:MAG: hypothetical protein U0414_29840 [Polyangiaceae bacterium]
MRWRSLLVLLLGAVIAAGSFTTGGCRSYGCAELCKAEADCCEPQFGCDPDTRDMDSCVATCEALIEKDGSFADTVDDQASCYLSNSCEDIRFQAACAD